MRDPIFELHMERLRSALLRTHKKQTIAKWICENTVLMGLPFSFKDHEYQFRIMQSTKREKVIRKCSQTGITELALRWHLGLLQLHPGTSCAYTLPTSSFASEVAKTRLLKVLRLGTRLTRIPTTPLSSALAPLSFILSAPMPVTLRYPGLLIFWCTMR